MTSTHILICTLYHVYNFKSWFTENTSWLFDSFVIFLFMQRLFFKSSHFTWTEVASKVDILISWFHHNHSFKFSPFPPPWLQNISVLPGRRSMLLITPTLQLITMHVWKCKNVNIGYILTISKRNNTDICWQTLNQTQWNLKISFYKWKHRTRNLLHF